MRSIKVLMAIPLIAVMASSCSSTPGAIPVSGGYSIVSGTVSLCRPLGANELLQVQAMQDSRVVTAEVVTSTKQFTFRLRPGSYVLASNQVQVKPTRIHTTAGERLAVNLHSTC